MRDAILTIAALAVIPCVCFGFLLLDRWHKRRAWREAHRFAQHCLRREQDRLRGRPGGSPGTKI